MADFPISKLNWMKYEIKIETAVFNSLFYCKEATMFKCCLRAFLTFLDWSIPFLLATGLLLVLNSFLIVPTIDVWNKMSV